MPQLTIKTEWAMGTLLYLRTDPLQLPRILVAVKALAGGSTIEYGVAHADVDPTYHYSVELSEEENALLRLKSDEEENE
jgi:hypothetical protein